MKLPTSGHFWLFGAFRVGTNRFHDLVRQNSTNPDPSSVNRSFFEKLCTLPKDEFETYVRNNLDKTLVYKVHDNYDRLKMVIESYPHVKIFQYRNSIREQLLSHKSSTLMQKYHWQISQPNKRRAPWPPRAPWYDSKAIPLVQEGLIYNSDAFGWLEQNKHKLKEDKIDNDIVNGIYLDWLRFLKCYEECKEKTNTYTIQLEELQSNPQKYFTNIELSTVISPATIRENTTISISDDYTMKFKEIVVRAQSLGLDVEDEF
jgi:hypothetical protein